jgi:hypothetical protein
MGFRECLLSFSSGILYLPLSCLKTLKIKIYKIIILPVFYVYETWSLTLREEQSLRVFENRLLRRIFGNERKEVAHSGEDCMMRNFMTCTYLLTYLLTYLFTHSLTHSLPPSLPPWCRILFGKLIVTQLVKQWPAFFMEPKGLLLCSQKPATGPHPEPAQFSLPHRFPSP